MSSPLRLSPAGPLSERMLRAAPPRPTPSVPSRSGGTLRVLHLLSQVPGRTGSGVYLEAMVRAAAREGVEQAVVCAVAHDAPEPALEGVDPSRVWTVRFGGPDLPFPVAGMSDVMPYPSRRFSTFDGPTLEAYLRAFDDAIRTAAEALGPEVLHSHHLWLATALARQRLARIPVVTSCHGTELRQLELAAALAPYVIPGCAAVDRVLALHEAHAQRIADRYALSADRIEIIGAGYREDLFHPHVAQGDEPRDPAWATVVYAGKLSRAKGLPWLLDAIASIDSVDGRPVRLLAAGSGAGPEADEIVERAATLRGRLEWLGALSQTELARVFRRADLFVLPSLYEGLPLVVLEALACGCRVVVTDLPGLEGWLPGRLANAGFVRKVALPPLVGPDEPRPDATGDFTGRLERAIHEQLQAAIRDDATARSEAASHVEEHGWRGVFDRVRRVYLELAGR